MILGTSAYKNGIRATTFRPEVDAGIGYLVGASSQAQVVRTYYLDLPGNREGRQACPGAPRAGRDAVRRRARRGRAATAARRPGRRAARCSATPRRSTGSVLAGRLAERFPERWDGDERRTPCRPSAGPGACRSVVVTVDGERARGCRRGGVETAGAASVTRYRGNAGVAAPDQRKHRTAVTGVTGAPSLTWAATGNGTGPEMTEQRPHGGTDAHQHRAPLPALPG